MSENNTKSVFETLSAVNVNDHIKGKNGLSYLPWAWAWGTLKTYYPDATYKVYEDENGWTYHTDGRSAWVKVSVTVQGDEIIEYLPCMDYRNRAIPLENLSAMDVNKTLQRALTKAIARHGLGLYIYAGEDLPDSMDGKRLETGKESAKSEKPGTKPFVRKEATYREKAIAMQKEMNISNADMMRVYGANKNTTDEEWELIYKKLEANKRLNEEDGVIDSE